MFLSACVGLKPFHCTVCEYASRSKSNLKAHMNRHSSERSHLCDLCGKKFKSKVTLKSHRLSHNAEGEWPVLCCVEEEEEEEEEEDSDMYLLVYV